MRQPSGKQQEILQSYQQNIQFHETAIQRLRKNKSAIALARLISILGGLGTIWYFWPRTTWVVYAIIVFAIIFIYLVFRDADLTVLINVHERLIRVNRHETNAMQHALEDYEDGQNYADPGHAYASDLDLFGPASLFQLLNRCHAEQSKKLLAEYLKTALDATAVKLKQEAATELSEKQTFCQNLQAAAMAKPLTIKTEEKLKHCIEAPPVGYGNPLWKWFRNIYPIIPISVTAYYIAGEISDKVYLTCLTGFYFISVLISRKIGPALEMLLDIEPEIDGLRKQFLLIETENFKSNHLQSLQNRLKPTGYKSTTDTMREFAGLLKKNDWRSNLLINLMLQIFLVWDLRLIITLNEWKKKNKSQFRDWFHVIAEMEVSNSMASLVHNEPGWCFPEVDEKYFHFAAKALGHPLIPVTTRITSDFSLEGTGRIALITGSNMAGKSTFLRSLGVNTVLALMGCPVCAGQMKLSNVKLISSMRVADNLAENTSTFYAELKKLQFIIESVNRKEKVFILLDEVLRGTNSTDRHKGTKALVSQLLKCGTVAVMATHDTDLAHSESANASVSNYHFEGNIMGEELSFDYKIKNGISESLNATALMKKIGIHFQD